MHFTENVVKFILTHIFLVLETVGLGHGVYRKLYVLIGGQRAEKFENHWIKEQEQQTSGISSKAIISLFQ